MGIWVVPAINRTKGEVYVSNNWRDSPYNRYPPDRTSIVFEIHLEWLIQKTLKEHYGNSQVVEIITTRSNNGVKDGDLSR